MPRIEISEEARVRRNAKRSDRRYCVEQPVRLWIPGSGVRSCGGTMRDVSRRGMQFWLPYQLWVEARVRVEWRGKALSGIVRHQREGEGGWYVGVELLAADEGLVADVLAQQVADLRAERMGRDFAADNNWPAVE